MSEYQLIKNYKDQENYRLSFNHLANQIFGIDFENWYQKSCWNDRYICYSFLHSDKVIANLSVSFMDIILNNQVYSAIQIGTVMTDPEYRNQGLSRRLMEIVMEEYQTRYSFIYLYANKSVLNFYTKFGFKKVIEPSYSLKLTVTSTDKTKIRKMDISTKEDWELLMELNSARRPISNKCGIMNAEGIFSWYCLNIFYDDIYLITDLKTVIIYQQEGNLLHLYDVVSIKEVRLNELIEMIPIEGVSKVLVHFKPDEENEKYISKFYVEPDDTLFIYPVSERIHSDMKLPKIAQA
ncbi:GNAT family N-acetyltransferase [Paenibacillus sp. 453mf]|uniref:GNAT family N-acetyltransferase n=1 Tax=Paenibacillus sp. 453mf TaxID=1761874 RepID=UPI0008E40665|nr:GNAT family N-acetyltransferase [Paenibacillus sp. 453mf]SFS40842.1 Acetyltransferase (GNAT) domain-containing protein [Paenibacillus sp. 453mf]